MHPTIRRITRPVAAVALTALLAGDPAFATPSAFALPSLGSASDPTPTVLATATLPAPEVLGVTYRSRSRRSARKPESAGVSQVHVGFFDPDGPQGRRLDLGVRGGPMLDENLQVGIGVDWIRRSENVSSVTYETSGPGGVPIQVTQEVSRASVNMFPILAFVQVSASDDMGVVPYFGAAAGYELLVLSGDDFVNARSYEGTFSGWGWQLWGGLGLPLGGRSRFTGEVYVNGAELARDATLFPSGATVRETVDADGVGARLGMAWGF